MNQNHLEQKTLRGGNPLEESKYAIILVHGRGAQAASMFSLAEALELHKFHWIAPQADQNTWYPYSFLAPIGQNEPGITNGIKILYQIVNDLALPNEQIFFTGFSQGACLVSEFLARHPAAYGGAFIFSGGVIGPEDTSREYVGSFSQMPVFIGCSDKDAHVPKWRVEETAEIFEQMKAKVHLTLYPGMPHTIIQDEIDVCKKIIQKRTV